MCDERKINNKFAQFNRVLMSYIDFEQAHSIATIILDDNLHENYPREHRLKLQALNAAMVVAYCRPFSGNKGVPDLPRRFIRNLTPDEKEIHDALIEDRNTVIAHSASEAWNMRPYYENLNGKHILIPLHHGVHEPFLREPTLRIQLLADKQKEACFEERQRFEKELKPYIPIADGMEE